MKNLILEQVLELSNDFTTKLNDILNNLSLSDHSEEIIKLSSDLEDQKLIIQNIESLKEKLIEQDDEQEQEEEQEEEVEEEVEEEQEEQQEQEQEEQQEHDTLLEHYLSMNNETLQDHYNEYKNISSKEYAMREEYRYLPINKIEEEMKILVDDIEHINENPFDNDKKEKLLSIFNLFLDSYKIGLNKNLYVEEEQQEEQQEEPEDSDNEEKPTKIKKIVTKRKQRENKFYTKRHCIEYFNKDGRKICKKYTKRKQIKPFKKNSVVDVVEDVVEDVEDIVEDVVGDVEDVKDIVEDVVEDIVEDVVEVNEKPSFFSFLQNYVF